MRLFLDCIQFITNVLTAIASGIAVYIFIFKRKVIASIFKVLLNYASQITISELRTKLEKLAEFDAAREDHFDPMMNLMNEIVGQIKGNSKLKIQCSEILEKFEFFTENPKNIITEAKKRNLISEFKENLRNIDVINIDELMGGKNNG